MLTASLRLPALRLPRLPREHMISSTMLALAVALYAVAGISVTSLTGPDGRAFAKAAPAGAQAAGVTTPPAPEPLQFKAVDPKDAVAYNASIPVSTLANPPARPFVMNATGIDAQRSLECLTAAIYYEAATEGVDGQRAVAQVVLNRLRHPAYPNSVCGVVFEGSERRTGCQFTFTCDGSLARAPHPAFWSRARAVAQAALAGYVYAPVGWATHYHTNWVVPYWSDSLVKLANVGTHIFYRWEGGWGRGPAFADRHAGAEPLLPKMSYLGMGGPTPEEEALIEGELALVEGELALVEGEAVAGEVPVAEQMQDRAVVRRFEPARREDVATIVAKQAKPGQKVDQSHMWALTGGGGSGDALGSLPGSKAPGAGSTK